MQNFAVTFLAEGQQDLQSSSLSLGQSQKCPSSTPWARTCRQRGLCGTDKAVLEAAGESVQRVLSPCPCGEGPWGATSGPILVLLQLQHPLG